MAYFDQFKKQPSKRDDWRDDENTRRPKRDGFDSGRSERPHNFDGSKPVGRPYGERKTFDRDHAPAGDRPRSYGERKPFDRDRAPMGDRPRSFEDRPKFGGPRPQRRDEHQDRFERPRFDRPAFESEPQEVVRDNILVGRNPIREALKADRDFEKLLVARGELIGSAREIVGIAREKRIVVQEVDRSRLDAIAPNHQGLIAIVSAYAYSTVDAMLALAAERGEAPLLVILDGVTDPHNLGAIIRSAECVGAHGVILPERRSVGLTPAAVKASAGAIEYMPVAREVNMTRLIERLKRENIWIYGAAMEGEDYRRVDFSGGAALVIGSEGDGLSRLVAENCDKLVSLPIRGKVDSLNASVAAGVLLYAMAASRS